MARTIKVEIKGDASGLKDALGDASGHLGKFGSVLQGVGQAVGSALTNLGGDLVGKGFGLLTDSVRAASDMAETVSKVGVLFGDAAPDVEAFASKAAGALGQSKQQALDAAATFATFGKSAGLTGKDLSGFSTGLTSLASDMASFSNATPQETIDAIGAALRGEAEPIRRFGVLLDDATLRNQALKLGLISTTKDALTPSQKVLAAQAAIMAQTTAAQGDFARTSDGLANKQRILAARFADAKVQLGQAFLPVALQVADFVLTKIIPAFERFAGWVQHIADVFRNGGWQEAAKEVLGKVADLFSVLGAWLRDSAAPAIWAATKDLARALADWVKDPALPWLVAHLGEWLSALGGWLTGTALPWLGEQMKALAGALASWVADPALPWLLSHLADWLSAFGGWIVGTAFPWLVDQAAGLAHRLAGWVVDAADELRQNLPIWLRQFASWMVSEAIPTVVMEMAKIAVKMADWVGDAAAALLANLPGWLWALGGWIGNSALPALAEFGVTMAKALAGGIWSGLTFMDDIASAIIEGLIDGLWNLSGRLASSVGDLITSAIPDKVADLLGINSPSRVMFELGSFATEGMRLGVESGRASLSSSSAGMAQAVTGAAASGQASFQPVGPIQVMLDGKVIAQAMAPHQRAYQRARAGAF